MPLFRGGCVTLVLLLTAMVVKMELAAVSPSPETTSTWWVVAQTSESNSESISETSLASTSPTSSSHLGLESSSTEILSTHRGWTSTETGTGTGTGTDQPETTSPTVSPTENSLSPFVFSTLDSISSSVSPTVIPISPSVSPTPDSTTPSVSPTSDFTSPSVSPTSDFTSPSVSPTSDPVSPSVSPTPDSTTPSVSPTSDFTSPSVSPTSESTSPSETTIDEGPTTALPPHTRYRGWTSTETGTGTDQTEMTSEAVSSSSEIGGLVHHRDRSLESRTSPTSHEAPSSTEKAGKGAVLTPKRGETATRGNRIRPTAGRNYRTASVSTTEVPSKKIGLVGYCLIVIAVLAGVCTFFVVTTVILCIKLSNQRQAYRMKGRGATELVCISKLLPDDRANPRKKKNRYQDDYFKDKMNIFNCDSEDDGLTLHSFVTEH